VSDGIVHILPEQVASQIAAGEVVERPASALKELVENSLDAGARTIAVETECGGGVRIAVNDDGCGMSPQDAVLSLRRHATSKIRDGSDIFTIRTLGFRGEALGAIASVSHLRMQTRRHLDNHGIELLVEGGEPAGNRACAVAPGTRIEVRELFFNTPARAKFLRSATAEHGATVEQLQRLALANPSVAFRLVTDGRLVIDAARAASPIERVRQLFGRKLADRMLPFEHQESGVRVWGLATTSQESFPTPRLVLTFVNRRVVRDRALLRAVAQAYQTLMPRGRHPAVVLFVELSPGEVDVNVHPMKSEVRFRRAGSVFEAVYHGLRARLADQGAQAPVENVSAIPSPPGDGIAEGQAVAGTVGQQPERVLHLLPDAQQVGMAAGGVLPLGFGRGTAEAQRDPSSHRADAPAAAPQYSTLRILGQLFAGFIALEADHGLVLVDQHAAHERVTFEKLRAQLRDGGIRMQGLLTPMTLEINPARAAEVIGSLAELRGMGFEVEPFGATTLLLKGAPAVFGAAQGARLLGDMIDSMGDQGFRLRGESAFEDWLKTLACHGSVRMGRVLTTQEITELLAELDRTEFKTNCPHGRPVHIEFRRGELERMFRR